MTDSELYIINVGLQCLTGPPPIGPSAAPEGDSMLTI